MKKLRDKIQGTVLEERISLHQCRTNGIDVVEQVDFTLMFYVVHEVPDPKALFTEINGILKPKGRIFLAEPPFHVSKKAFEHTLQIAESSGLTVVARPTIRFSKTALLRK